MGIWEYEENGEEPEESITDIEIPDYSEVWADSKPYEDLAETLNGFTNIDTRKKTYTDTKTTALKTQISATYDVTDGLFLGGGFFYSQW
ncbi:MAG: hypothetical protein GX969_05365 [Firmicutes bacterium]|nr:hypothetical protein [Bacillota bacterium]